MIATDNVQSTNVDTAGCNAQITSVICGGTTNASEETTFKQRNKHMLNRKIHVWLNHKIHTLSR